MSDSECSFFLSTELTVTDDPVFGSTYIWFKKIITFPQIPHEKILNLYGYES
jgi:hypothetical protein